MSRRVLARYTVAATLVADAPIHVGGATEGLATDMLCAVDGLGRYFLPGPSLAGALRAELRSRGVEAPALWGGDSTDNASQVVVADAPAQGRTPVVEIRDGVSIDAARGTAKPGLLYTREVLPAGTAFRARITVDQLAKDNRSGRSAAEALAKHIARLLASEDGLSVGAFTTKGLGKLSAHVGEDEKPAVQLTKVDLGTRDGMLGLLRGAKPSPVDFTSTALPGRAAEVRVEIPWRARGPILVSRALDGGPTNTIPLTAGSAKGARLAIPGSSIKGALRAQATRIVATMGNPAPAAAAITDLFGSPGDSTRDPETGKRVNSGSKGALRVAEVLSTGRIPAGTTLGIPQSDVGGDAPALQNQLAILAANRDDGSAGLSLKVGDHVAIDRWTGGAYESALYSVLEPWETEQGDWTPIRLTVDLAGIPERRRDAALGLLALVLQDLCDGWFGIGFGTARGYGAIEAHAEDAMLVGVGIAEKSSLAALLHGESSAMGKQWVSGLWPLEGEPR